MAKVKNADKVTANIFRALRKIVDNKTLLNTLGHIAVRTVRADARLGKNPDGSKFEPIDPKWRAKKKKLRKVNQTDEFYKPGSVKSRLSFTGELLRSIDYSIRKGQVTVKAKGSHSGYTNLNGEVNNTVTNEKIIEGQKAQGRTVFGVSEKLRKITKSEVQRTARRYIAKFNKG